MYAAETKEQAATILKQRAIDSTFYPVAKQRYAWNEVKGNMTHYLYRTDTGKHLIPVSERYELVHNRDVVQPFVDKFGVDALTYCRTFNRQHVYKFETGRVFTMPDERYPNDTIKEQLIVTNSYDKTRAFSFKLGAFRMVCSNGLYTGLAVLAYKKIHVGHIPVQAIVSQALANYTTNGFDAWFNMAKKRMTIEEQFNVLASFRPFEEKKEDANSAWYDANTNKQINNRIQQLGEHYLKKPESIDNQRNAWGLFNQMNRAIAGVLTGGQINKVILGNKKAEEHVLNTL